jgi:hypothetical protein
MFTKIHANGAVNSDGYTVEITNISKLRYSEMDRTLTIPLELLMGECDFVVHMEHITCWDAPFGTEIINPRRLSEIRERVERGLHYLGVQVRFA